MKGTLWGAAVLAVGLMAIPQAAHAQDWRRDGRYDDGRYGRSGGRFDFAFERGFRDGTKQGNKDARGRYGFKPSRHDDYRNGIGGYRSGYGSRSAYSTAYRRGFEQGYQAAFDQVYGRGRYDRYDDRDDRYGRRRY